MYALEEEELFATTDLGRTSFCSFMSRFFPDNDCSSYLQDLASLRRQKQPSADETHAKALAEANLDLTEGPVHPRYQKRLATRLIHVQLKGW